MSPVVRVSQDVSERLKAHAEPFVDTPSSVIERLLDYFEKNQPTLEKLPRLSQNKAYKKAHVEACKADQSFTRQQVNIFLAPAVEDNIRATILQKVSIKVAEKYLKEKELEDLKAAMQQRTDFNCWAMTDSNIATFNKMRPGDIVFMTVKGTGSFNYVGKVLTKFRNEAMGNYLWPVAHEKPWELIYLLDDIRQVNIEKSKLVITLGYQPAYVVPGIICVKPSRVTTVIERYGSIDQFINNIA